MTLNMITVAVIVALAGVPSATKEITMASYSEIAGAEAAQQVAAAIVKAAGEVMTAHGKDPNGSVIVATGFAIAIREMGKHVDPVIPKIIAKMLAE